MNRKPSHGLNYVTQAWLAGILMGAGGVAVAQTAAPAAAPAPQAAASAPRTARRPSSSSA
ncbi:MAG: hypothetical protein E6H65_13385 [Betaproteobacteria bacterium]|nr:MAG: hypothetical protein E6H65_13385 [Betaproteobacteria bacterium]